MTPAPGPAHPRSATWSASATRIVQTGMGWVAGPRLVAATAEAGGLGHPGLGHHDLRRAGRGHRRGPAAHRPARSASTCAPTWPTWPTAIALMIDNGVRVASFAQAPNPALVDPLQEAGLVVMPTIGARRHAEKVAEWGVDAVIAQGGEGGGHTGTVPTSLLTPAVVDAVGDRVAVLAAGGFFDGRGLVAALAYGAVGHRHGDPLPAHPGEPGARRRSRQLYLRHAGDRHRGLDQGRRRPAAGRSAPTWSTTSRQSGWLRSLPACPGQRPRLPQGDRHHAPGPAAGGAGHEAGQRAVVAPGGHGGQRPDDDQGRAGRRADRRRRAADRSGRRRDRASCPPWPSSSDASWTRPAAVLDRLAAG